MAVEDVPVVVIGGSLVGLSTALFLGAQGIPSLVVERHPGTAIHPRAALVSQRTVELYRTLGLQAEIEAAAAAEFVQNGAIVSVESLGGKELDWYFRSINEGVESLSPAPRLFITQIGLEPIVRRHAEASGARFEYGTEAVALEQDDSGVTVHLRARDGGAERSVRARYAVAADGAKSPTREQLGIPMVGHGTFSDSITIYFRADVNPLLGDRNLSVVYVFHPRLQGFFRFSLAGDAGFLVVNSTIDESGVRSTSPGEDMGEERCIEYVRRALGAPDLPVEIESVQRWSSMADWAERFQEGRVFLAGDSAHVMPPTGGFGGNCGVHDADNLAWKLAAVLRGEAGPGLLSTYDAERRPVGEFTVEQAYTRYVLRLDPALGKENLMPIVGEATVELGYRYHSDAVLPEPGEDGSLWESPDEPTARPGSRAPHLALAHADGAASSTLDLAGRGFTLLAGPAGEAWCQAAGAVSAQLGVPIESQCVGDTPAFAELYGTGAEGAVLLRPDGFVAWRDLGPSHDERAQAMEQILDGPCAGCWNGSSRSRRRPSGAGGSCPRSADTFRRLRRGAGTRHQRHRHGGAHGRRRRADRRSARRRDRAGFDELLPLADGARLILPIHPGFGASADDPSIDCVQDYVMHYLDLLDRLGLDEISLVGHSLGGCFAATIALQQPDRVRRLVLMAPWGLHVPEHPTVDFFSIPEEQVLAYLYSDVTQFDGLPPPPAEFLAERAREAESLARVTGQRPYDAKLHSGSIASPRRR